MVYGRRTVVGSVLMGGGVKWGSCTKAVKKTTMIEVMVTIGLY